MRSGVDMPPVAVSLDSVGTEPWGGRSSRAGCPCRGREPARTACNAITCRRRTTRATNTGSMASSQRIPLNLATSYQKPKKLAVAIKSAKKARLPLRWFPWALEYRSGEGNQTTTVAAAAAAAAATTAPTAGKHAQSLLSDTDMQLSGAAYQGP